MQEFNLKDIIEYYGAFYKVVAVDNETLTIIGVSSHIKGETLIFKNYQNDNELKLAHHNDLLTKGLI